MPLIRSGTVSESTRRSGQWVFVDIGFASEKRSCGILVDDGDARALTFSDLQAELAALCTDGSSPLNLVIEAPLSVAFGSNGNPAGRSVEKRGGQSRYWYVGLGCSVLVATTYLLRSIVELPPSREIRLFEGLVSFKSKGIPSSHTDDVMALREVAWSLNATKGRIVRPDALAMGPGDRVISAFRVAAMDFGVPPIIVVGG
jgi:hypothetical protein